MKDADDIITAKWPAALLEMMECYRRVLAAAGIAEPQLTEISHKLALEIARDFGGLQQYIPKSDAVERAIRDQQIYHEYRQGNTAALARKYQLTEAQIYSIYKNQRQLHTRKIQPSLF